MLAYRAAFSDDTATNTLGASRNHNSSGFVGGGQIGCDYQFVPGWVLGAEGRGALTSLKGSSAGTVRNLITGVTLPSQFTVGNDFLASATTRLGYSFVDRWLFYVKGGAAWTNEKVDDAFTNFRDCGRPQHVQHPDRMDDRNRYGVGFRTKLVGNARV
jgi:outer membrane immunogenic protein